MTKIVYNGKHGGFSLSEAAILRYAEISGFELYADRSGPMGGLGYATWWRVPEDQRPADCGDRWYSMSMEERQAYNAAYDAAVFRDRDLSRHDPVLVQVVEELGTERASGPYARLLIAEVPSGGKYRIDEYEGCESVETPDSYEWIVAP
jgi:hypothetical protein